MNKHHIPCLGVVFSLIYIQVYIYTIYIFISSRCCCPCLTWWTSESSVNTLCTLINIYIICRRVCVHMCTVSIVVDAVTLPFLFVRHLLSNKAICSQADLYIVCVCFFLIYSISTFENTAKDYLSGKRVYPWMHSFLSIFQVLVNHAYFPNNEFVSWKFLTFLVWSTKIIFPY